MAGKDRAFSFDTDCPDCIEARLRMKAQGFRNWRSGYACYEHAALDMSGDRWRELMADVTPAMVAQAERELGLHRIIQPDLFTTPNPQQEGR